MTDSQRLFLLRFGWVILFLFASTPFIIWSSLDLDKRPYWLETLAWTFPLILCGGIGLSIIGYMIYENVRK